MVLPKKGDIIKFPRGLYDHYGIYIGPAVTVLRSSSTLNQSDPVAVITGNGRIIHRSGSSGGSSTASASNSSSIGAKSDLAEIREDKLKDVAGESGQAEICNFLDENPAYTAYVREEVVARAKSRLGEQGYNLLFKNCEHFVTWCRYGVEYSQQVIDSLKKFLGLTTPHPILMAELIAATLAGSDPEEM